MNPQIDKYLVDGCMRCPKGATPKCKVNNWRAELKQLRAIILDCGLTEELKWGMPCYMFENRNVLILAAFKEYCSVGFFKGALLKDSKGLLVKPGESSQAARGFRFTSLEQVVEHEPAVRAYIAEAIELEKSGAKVEMKKDLEPMPEELKSKLDETPALKKAFNALTPGRQRGYIIYISAPKQSKTRETRIEKCKDLILQGKGLYDDMHCSKKR